MEKTLPWVVNRSNRLPPLIGSIQHTSNKYSYLCSSQPSVCHGKCSLLFYIVINTHFWFCNIMTFDKSLWMYPTSFNVSELVFKQVKSYQEILFVDHILSLWYPITISPFPEDMAPSAKGALSLSPTLCPSSSCWNIDVQHWKPGQTGVRDHEWHWTQLQSQRETRAMDNNLSMTTHMGPESLWERKQYGGERGKRRAFGAVCGWIWKSTRERNNFRNYQNIWMNTVPQGPFESPSYIKVLYFHFANKISNLHLGLPMRESSTVELCR